ncbi:glycoside hydrolase family 140 protein [Danxiaibacter flavus]|uniref:Glycoside hydrolase family 140 protein n=1 Tax=Danxiaibacter flavus TaxID=3049108 RepID=A0ABV3ZMS5_9BACT|nr:glycoside hydrolase family 140 protein [Chitinophagaceae bacterium DXS]
MKRLALLAITMLVSIYNFAQNNPHGRIKVTADGHYLQHQDGTPFFWLGDTGWELFHRLTLPEIKSYLDNRASKGFTVIQAVALAEFDGVHKPNRYGELPLINDDPTQPNDSYFKLIDSAVMLAAERDLFIGLLPTWGDKVTKMWGEGPVVFDSINAYAYGKWIGNRYKNNTNIIWILGGDRPAVRDSMDWRPVWRQMARGIIEATNHQCLITYHPSGGDFSTSQFIHNEPWLDVNMFQSGHGNGHDTHCWELVTRDRRYSPTKPTLDAEPNYEDHPVDPWPKWNVDNGYFRAYDVRKQTYRSVFAGACGVTYGHHSVWQFVNERDEIINFADRGWRNAINRPGAFQVGFLRKLIESRPMLNRIPDSTIIVGDKGLKGEHMEAFRGGDNSYAMIYLPAGKRFSINTTFMTAKEVVAWWFNPKDGSTQKINTLKRTNNISFTPPIQGVENDWVLVIDDASKKYKEPGR